MIQKKKSDPAENLVVYSLASNVTQHANLVKDSL